MLANLGLILVNRAQSANFLSVLRSRNSALRWIVIATIVFLLLVVYVPALRNLFRFGTMHPTDWLLCLAATAISIAWSEVVKYFAHRPHSRQRKNE